MDLYDFWDLNQSLTIQKLPSAQVGVDFNYAAEEQATYVEEEPDNGESAFDYAQPYIDEEERMALENSITQNEGEILRPDTPTTIGGCVDDDVGEASGIVFSKFNFDNRLHDNELSINSYQEQIIELICANSVVIIQGPTGCGKSTQVPQFILDYCQSQSKYCKIAVTQPRRIAAITVAKRVSEERGWPLGSVVGYQVALNNETSDDTVLTYMTTGVLLQKLVLTKNLNQFTHVIIDEVHERDADMDFLLLLVRKFVRCVSKHVKVILMSATFDVDHFSKYFMVSGGSTLVPAPVIDITKQQHHVVNIYYLNQFTQLLGGGILPHFQSEEPVLMNEIRDLVPKLLEIFNTLDTPNLGYRGSVLIFLPGIFEIEDMYELLTNNKTAKIKWHVVPLHSSITSEEQKKAFDKAPVGYRKVILSTNIAESSITVPDVSYVIDFCLTKVLICDPVSNYTSLKLSWASHTNCQQRSGRVGRVSSGRVYRLIPESFYHSKMERDIQPEMLRSPLHRLVLLAKRLDLEIPPHGILALAIDIPSMRNIEKTVALLKESGALLITSHGSYDARDGDLTHVGQIMSQLPLDIHVSKLIILGYMFSTLKECVIMGAAMSLQNIFSCPFNERMKGYTSKLYWADCSCSDLIAYLHVYCVWERKRQSNSYRISGSEKNWMRKNFLQPRTMREWRHLITEIKQRLDRMGIREPITGRSADLSEHEKAMMLKVVISGAFYPNFFVRSSEGGQVDESMAVRELGGRDPYNTVYFSGKPDNQPAKLYVQSIRELLQDCGQNMYISYENSNKIYVQFKHDWVPSGNSTYTGTNNAVIPGKIAIEVYNAVKYRHLKLPTTIRCLSSEESQYRVKQWNIIQAEKKSTSNTQLQSILPSMETLTIEIKVSYINNPGHFFVHNIENAKAMRTLSQIETQLNEGTLRDVNSEIVVGQLYAAPFEGKYYRARVIYMVTEAKGLEAVVIFTDYGNINNVAVGSLKQLDLEQAIIPPLALECVLTNVQPSHEMNPHALWSRQSRDEFVRITESSTFYGKIYSIVDNIVSLEIYKKNGGTSTDSSINQWLITKKYAQFATESFLSQDNHKKREFCQSNACESDYYTPEIEQFDKTNEMPAPSPSECRFSMTLKGPHSPLEMQIFSIVQCSINKTVGVEWHSVNSVLLDTDPQDPHDRLLVAGSINQTSGGSRLSLRHTTIMPKIHGFPAMMAMIFCPKMELHTNRTGTRITSILCGLGQNSNSKLSLYPAHDLAMNLDFELNDDIITKVNEIRYFMNNAIEAMSMYMAESSPMFAVETCQNEIRKNIRLLLRIKHKCIERQVLPNSYVWGKLPSCVEIVSPPYENADDIWPMHSSVSLLDDKVTEIAENLDQILDGANSLAPLTSVSCKLCKITLCDVAEMRVHLVSRLHKDNLIAYNESKD